MERSVKFCLASMILGVVNVAIYWVAVFLDKAPGPEVACAGIVEIIAPVVAYYIYQAKLKDSRNKYGIDANGIPFSQKNTDGQDEQAVG